MRAEYPQRLSRQSSGSAALPQHAAALALCGAAPDADLFATLEREFEARCSHPALATDLFRDFGVLVILRIEDAGVESATCAEHAPFEFVFRHVDAPLERSSRATLELHAGATPEGTAAITVLSFFFNRNDGHQLGPVATDECR
jgi:hypothetical protein